MEEEELMCDFCGAPSASNNLSVTLNGDTIGCKAICETCANIVREDCCSADIVGALFAETETFAWSEHCHGCPDEHGCEHKTPLSCHYVRDNYKSKLNEE